nr:putative inactive leucine-rich repeat receptor kinase xiao [Quercus suber]
MIMFTGGGNSLKLAHAFFILLVLVHLRPALGFISGVGVGDANNIRCPERERQTLLKFKKALVDDYGRLSSWRSKDKNCCNWKGVHCSNQTGHVLELHLGQNRYSPDQPWRPLRGMISPCLLEFPDLTFLDLSENDFNQSNLPEFIGSLSNLKHLDLSWTNLSGPISHQLENLSHLQFLNLLGNDLIIIENLEWLSHLPSIEYLDLTSINLSVVNDWLEVVSHLSNLTTLNLWGCDLPSQMFSSLSGFNYWKSLTSLESLNLNPNKLVSLPKPIGDICTLRKLYFFFNNANAQLVELVNNLSRYAKDSLEDLGLSYNQLTGSLPNFTLFPSLKYLGLSNNILNGTVPKSIGSLYKLEWLDMSSNFLQGTMSEAHFSNLSKLRHWHELVVLNLAGNKFSGEVPNSLGRLSNLETLKLFNNSFSGNLPSALKKCSSLKVIDLGDNRFSGKVPAWIGEGLPKLIVLILRSNKFDGSIPLNLCWLTHLQTLDLSLNDISGTIPFCLNNFTAMAQEGYDYDMINGLDYFSYVGNFTSQVQYFGSATVVLKGREDEYGTNLGLLVMINLSGNKLIGKLPTEISSLLELVALNVSGKT